MSLARVKHRKSGAQGWVVGEPINGVGRILFGRGNVKNTTHNNENKSRTPLGKYMPGNSVDYNSYTNQLGGIGKYNSQFLGTADGITRRLDITNSGSSSGSGSGVAGLVSRLTFSAEMRTTNILASINTFRIFQITNRADSTIDFSNVYTGISDTNLSNLNSELRDQLNNIGDSSFNHNIEIGENETVEFEFRFRHLNEENFFAEDTFYDNAVLQSRSRSVEQSSTGTGTIRYEFTSNDINDQPFILKLIPNALRSGATTNFEFATFRVRSVI